MDLNPDEALAAGWLKPGSMAARLLSALSLFSFREARTLVVLDRFMKQRLIEKGIPEDKIALIPPWSHDDVIGYDTTGREAFRSHHGLTGKFVVMYSGNHSPCHPLDTLLKAALRLAGNSEIVFCFVGGGSEFAKVKQFQLHHGLHNIVTLPYQALDQLSSSLSAADLLIIPTQAEYFSAYALRNMMGTIRRVRQESNPNLAYRILVTLLDRRNRTHRNIFEQLQATFGQGVFTTVIEVDTKLRESPIAGLPITQYKPGSRGSQQYRVLAQELMEYAKEETNRQTA
jgi:glycosyltransferase involved in cell wall biosynthesis